MCVYVYLCICIPIKKYVYLCICILFLMVFFFFQGGVTEEQMLKFMGANTQLSPLQATKLLEVCVASCKLSSFILQLLIIFYSLHLNFWNCDFRMRGSVLLT